jgi:hypothetical protein
MIRARRHALRTLSAGLLFAALGMVACRPREAPPKPVPPIAASVDGTPIFLAAVQREVSRVRRTEEGKNGVAETSSSPKEIAKAVLGPLIDRQILLAQARADKLVVSDADIQRATDALAETAQQAVGEALARLLRRSSCTTRPGIGCSPSRRSRATSASRGRAPPISAPTPTRTRASSRSPRRCTARRSWSQLPRRRRASSTSCAPEPVLTC